MSNNYNRRNVLQFMSTQVLFCLTNSPLHAHQVVDWLRQEGFLSPDIHACLPGKSIAGSVSPSHLPPLEKDGGAILCGEVEEWACTRQITVLGRRLLKSAQAVTRSFSDSASLASFLITKGFSEPLAQRYEEVIQSGGILISVHTASLSKLRRAREIMEVAGTQNIAEITTDCRRWLHQEHSSA
jgi:hypothetical protein